MQDLFQAQRSFFNAGKTRPISFRIQKLKELKALLQENETVLYEEIYKDFKKSEFETYTNELVLLYHEIKIAINNLKSWAQRKSVSTGLVNLPGKSYIISEPLGVSLVIGAWNYPYQLSLAPLVPAIAAGNTIILKPSELPKHTSAIMAKLINNHFDPGFLKVVEGGVPETTELLKLDFDKIFFTGSPKVGTIVYEAAAKNLTPVTLELGGKSPTFISADCDLKLTVKRLVWAKFLNAGQTCIAPDYVMVDEKIHDDFVEKCIAEINKVSYSIENGNYVQIINKDNVDRLQKMIDYEKVVYGGTVEREERFIEPTLMTGCSFTDTVMQEEIFGPILPILKYSSLSEAIEKVIQLPKPLSCYVFTKNKSVRNEILSKVSFGGGAVNDAVMHISNSELPFGGVGQSGMGNYHGEAGFKAFSHYKSILQKTNWFELPLKYPPYTKSKLKWIKRLFSLQ
ncbi:aldehyde dehydrogenase [Luteirhabdus pelagi]|uniref:aldehyde dehydrogenase n=1 Tax=Luteirhabdus pelagi TaxID=2792783 RepID=UPI00193A57AA|nr:aldehyde dehydrogenase [Luteirhabdus pelagi]